MLKQVKLNHYALLNFSGRDAEKFLQGQLTQDIEQIKNGLLAMTGYCSPKGRLLATGVIWYADNSFYWQVPQELEEYLLRRLKMYVLRDQVTINSVAANLHQVALFGDQLSQRLTELSLPIPAVGQHTHSASNVKVLRLREKSALLLLPHEEDLSSFGSYRDDPMDKAWAGYLIEEGIAELSLSQQDQWIPQMLNLDLIQGISFKKGCYTGQEIVARTHFLGQVKRRLGVYRCQGSLHEGDTLFAAEDPSQTLGHVIKVLQDDTLEGTLCCAVVHVETLQKHTKLHVGGHHSPLIPQDLPYAIPELRHD